MGLFSDDDFSERLTACKYWFRDEDLNFDCMIHRTYCSCVDEDDCYYKQLIKEQEKNREAKNLLEHQNIEINIEVAKKTLELNKTIFELTQRLKKYEEKE